jgi:Asp-tRNA(Asn)/Glu-tRNA(Gln) amidotransferase A subunit family amidase
MKIFTALAAVFALGMASAQAAAPGSFRLEEATIADVHAAMKAGRLTCRQLVSAYLARIEGYDKKGPALNAITLVNPNALIEAEAMDVRFKQKGLIGPLHCVPAIVKDNFETIGLQSAGGSLALQGFASAKDAFQVARIKAAGAIVIAKSNMAEWAFSPVETVNSLMPGYTRNPYALDRSTAGSSGGTAAAIAANFGLIGLGSDTGDSIRGPSAHQALAGIRSTMGLTSRAGVIPLNLLADIAGPMTRTLADATIVLQVIAEADPADPVTAAARERKLPDYRASLVPGGLKGARIGILHQAYEREPDGVDKDVTAVFAAAIEALKAAGAVVVDPAQVDLTGIQRNPNAGTCMGFKYDVNAWFASHGERIPVHSLDEVIASKKFHPSIEVRILNAQKAEPQGPDSDACKQEMGYRRAFGEAVTKAMDTMKLDAFVYPTWSFPPRLIGDLNTPGGDNSQVFSPTSGFPAINVPMGYTRGNRLPAGITFFGRAWDEATLIKLAYGYEQATKHRRAPDTTPPLAP